VLSQQDTGWAQTGLKFGKSKKSSGYTGFSKKNLYLIHAF